MKTVGATWRDVQRRLASVVHEPNPREGQKLVAHVLGIEDREVMLQEDAPFPANRVEMLNGLAARRMAGAPLQYVLGKADFWRHSWKVGPGVLIPRPDTEILVREALGRIDGTGPIAEVGVGSGCVVGSVLFERPDVTAIGTDVSADALKIAEGNLRELGVDGRCTLVRADVLGGIGGPFQLIMSNPPYIGEDEWRLLDAEVRDFEPETALKAGPEGLDVYRELIVQAAAKLVPGGWLCLEIGWQQGEAVTTLLQQQSQQPWYEISTIQDLAQRDRVICARRRSFA